MTTKKNEGIFTGVILNSVENSMDLTLKLYQQKELVKQKLLQKQEMEKMKNELKKEITADVMNRIRLELTTKDALSGIDEIDRRLKELGFN